MSVYDYKVKTRTGEEFDLSSLKGKVFMIVNTATGCGFTPQYEGIEKLYEKYNDKGFEVLDFPCNQFGHQAPGTDEEIHEFCTGKYNTKYEQMAKAEVNGENELPLFTFIKKEKPDEEPLGLKDKMIMKSIEKLSSTCKNAGDIKWNFTELLVDREGNVVKRYSPTVNPEDIDKDLEAIL
ncbi:MAG: glutathione peroxidase [Lachnospiraceae bacterium]|nr:glutathione peroxidase [Lachnospiraceae bacterium]